MGRFVNFSAHFADQCFEWRHVGASHQRFQSWPPGKIVIKEIVTKATPTQSLEDFDSFTEI